MPNHVANHITFDGNKEEVTQLLNKIKGTNGLLDFNKIISRDKFLEDNYNAPRKDNQNFDEIVKKLKDVYNTTSGYNWTSTNWGTKWNAYHIEAEGTNSMSFDTAWSHPLPIIEKISEMFPEITIKVLYADEDLGNNAGKYEMLNGDVFWDCDDTIEGCYDIYFELNGGCMGRLLDHLDNYQDDELLKLYKDGDNFIVYIINKINLIEEYYNITEFADKNFPTKYEVDLIGMLEPIYKHMLLVRNLTTFVKS